MDKLHILLISAKRTPSAVLCGDLQCRELEARGVISYRFRLFSQVTGEDLRRADVVGFIRSDSRMEDYLAKKCRKAGKYLLYILDDDLLNVPGDIPSGAHYRKPGVRKRIREILSRCDCLVTPSPELLKRYGDLTETGFLITEPSGIRRTGRQENEKVRIGFAGSVDRGGDVDGMLSEALEILAEKYRDRAEIRIFGAETEISRRLGLTVIPYVESYEEYQRKMEEENWDIGLAPMPDTPFHACKHYNKLAEYAGYGIVGVYSHVAPYTRGVKDGENGILTGNRKEDWVAAVSRLVEDGELRKAMCRSAMAWAATCTPEKAADRFWEDLSRVRKTRPGKNRFFGFTLYRRGYLLLRRCRDRLKK